MMLRVAVVLLKCLANSIQYQWLSSEMQTVEQAQLQK